MTTKHPPRRKPMPSKVGADPCFNCGRPGSTCGDCGEVLCTECNKQPHLAEGHEPVAHLVEPTPAQVIQMALGPFDETASCEMCGFARIVMRYCSGSCVPAPRGGFANMRANGTAAQPHMHVNCERCRYEWLTTIRPSGDV